MRVRNCLMQREYWSARHPFRLQCGHCLLATFELYQPVLDDSLERFIIVASRSWVPKTNIVGQLRHVHRLSHLRPLIRHHHDRDKFIVATTKNASGAAVGMKRAHAWWLKLLASQRTLRDVHFMHVEIRV